MRKYEVVTSNGVIKVIEANYITVQDVSGVTIFWFEEYNDHHTVVAVAPPSALIRLIE